MEQAKRIRAAMDKGQRIKAASEYIALGLFLFLLIVLQTTWVHAIKIGGVVPDLVLVFCICFSLKQGTILSVCVSVLCGFLQDVCAMGPFFYDALLYLYISAGCVWLSRRIFCRRKSMVIACVFLATLFYGAALYGLQLIALGVWPKGGVAVRSIFFGAAYHAIAAPVLYPVAARFAKRRSAHREKGA